MPTYYHGNAWWPAGRIARTADGIDILPVRSFVESLGELCADQAPGVDAAYRAMAAGQFTRTVKRG
jgi:hypothetical protein